MKLGKYYEAMDRQSRSKFIKQLQTALNKSEASVRSYINGHRAIQPQDVYKIVRTTNKSVLPHELRPDVYPAMEGEDGCSG